MALIWTTHLFKRLFSSHSLRKNRWASLVCWNRIKNSGIAQHLTSTPSTVLHSLTAFNETDFLFFSFASLLRSYSSISCSTLLQRKCSQVSERSLQLLRSPYSAGSVSPNTLIHAKGIWGVRESTLILTSFKVTQVRITRVIRSFRSSRHQDTWLQIFQADVDLQEAAASAGVWLAAPVFLRPLDVCRQQWRWKCLWSVCGIVGWVGSAVQSCTDSVPFNHSLFASLDHDKPLRTNLPPFARITFHANHAT